jgi:O-antigen/teichoic acid export membrane protein
MYQSVFDVFSIITWPIVMGGIVLATPIMHLLAPGFEQSDDIMRVLMIATGIIFFAHLPTFVVITLGEQRRMLKAYAWAAIIAIVLYVVLIPVFSYWAAAWITVLVESLVLFMAWHRVRQVTQYNIKWKTFNKSLLSSLLMAGSLWLMLDWNLFLLLIIGASIYIFLMFMFKVITGQMIKEIIFARHKS